MKTTKYILILVLAVMTFGIHGIKAQNVADYAGEYACLSHGVAGMRIQSTAEGFKMQLCKDMILNDCSEQNLHKTLGAGHSLLAATGNAGGPLKDMTATFTHEGDQPVVQIKFSDGLIMEFVRQ
ncbi:MAG: hypothetical protein RLZZ519_3212 [Bacteroidota bacterium]|jgi:hypothetical protein